MRIAVLHGELVVYLTTADNWPILASCGISYVDSTSREAYDDPLLADGHLAGIAGMANSRPLVFGPTNLAVFDQTPPEATTSLGCFRCTDTAASMSALSGCRGAAVGAAVTTAGDRAEEGTTP